MNVVQIPADGGVAMEGLFVLIVLVALALPVATVIALVAALRARRDLREHRVVLMGIVDRLAVLEAGNARGDRVAAPAAPWAATAFAPPPETRSETPAEPDVPTLDAAVPAEAPEAADVTPAEAPVPEPTPPPTDAPAALAAREATMRVQPGLEERIGTRWAVWIGGAALALGLVFLVQYSIEQGLFGPLARLVLAAAASLGVLGLGERLRRSAGGAEAPQRFAGADVPAILTAAGATGLFATVWAAHALYDFVGVTLAFAALGAVALTTLAAALVHGPWLGALGLLGAYGTPILVHSQAPRPAALVVFLGVVTAAAFAVARLRRWRHVAATAFGFALLWGLRLIDLAGAHTFEAGWAMAHAALLIALVGGLLIAGLDPIAPEPRDEPLDLFGLGLLTLAALLVLAAFDASGDLAGRIGLVASLAVLAALAWKVPAVLPAAAIAGLAGPLAATVADLDVWRSLEGDTFARGADGLVVLRPRVVADWLAFHGLVAAALVAAGLGGALRAPRDADRARGWLVFAAAAAGILTLLVGWGRVAAFESRWDFAAAGLGLAALFTAATLRLARDEAADTPAHGVAVAAVAALAALAATLTIALDRAALTVALGLLPPAIAFVWRARPLPVLRWAAAIAVVAVAGRLAWDPAIVTDLAPTPIFNALLLGWGVPALGAAYAAWTFRATADDLPRAIVEGAAIAFTGLFALVEIRHWATGGDLLARQIGLVETGLDVAVAFVLSAGAQRVAGKTGSRVFDIGALAIGTIGAVTGLLALLVARNPLFVGIPSTGSVVGALMLGYGAPMAAGAVTARLARLAGRPTWYVGLTAVGAYALGLMLVTLLVRHAFQGARLAMVHGTTSMELWALSAAWLATGVATLIAGVALASQPLRLLSGLVVAATATKIFLVDMADAEGIWRAFSFLGLGAVLIGIAFVYQRVLFADAGRRGDG
jgi:uncharacterized membrane protein